ncbi:Voltage-dependent N-type calcium channel subunit alpha-1B [Actinoplanes sp. SE50/110]|nr:hypothetical protein [Actinoplanes sp. SE50/110]AEV81906.1 Voltage-dependent N-type calcium channel subunit alpha-1B [Actinoplanes sp. SE50/110]
MAGGPGPAGGSGGLRGQPEHLVDPAGRGQPALQPGDPAGQLGHRPGQIEQVEQEGDQRRHGQPAGRHRGAADAEHHHEGHLHRHPADQPGRGGPAGRLSPTPPGPGRRPVRGRRLGPLGAVRLDRAQRAERPFQQRAQVADGRLGPLPGLADPPGQHRGHREHQHQDRGHHAEQHRVEPGHQHHRAGHLEDPGGQVDQVGGGGGAQLGGVAGDPGQQVAGRGPVQHPGPQAQQPVDQAAPGAQHHPLRGGLQQIHPDRAEQCAGRQQGGQQGHRATGRRPAGEGVEQAFHRQRRGQAGQAAEEHQAGAGQQAAAVRAQVTQKQPQARRASSHAGEVAARLDIPAISRAGGARPLRPRGKPLSDPYRAGPLWNRPGG